MDRKETLRIIVSLLKELQKESGEEADEIYETTRPIGGLSGFDSLTGVILTVHCFEKFGIKNDGHIISLCEGTNKNGHPCALSVGEIADRILTLANKG